MWAMTSSRVMRPVAAAGRDAGKVDPVLTCIVAHRGAGVRALAGSGRRRDGFRQPPANRCGRGRRDRGAAAWGAGAGTGAAAGAAACAAGAGALASAPASMRISTVPCETRSPTLINSSRTTPACVVGTSIVALSDSSVTMASSAATLSPGCTSSSITGTSL